MTLVALTAATIEYVEILKRRHLQRQFVEERAASEETALRGLVRVFLADSEERIA